MDWKKLNPWNWFKHEEREKPYQPQVPVRRNGNPMPSAWGGTHSLWQLHSEIERLFDDLWRGFGGESPGGMFDAQSLEGFHPAVDVSSRENSYEITMEAPGLDVGDLTIEQLDDRLIIRGEKKEETEDKDRHFYRIERRYGTFQRILSLPDDADAGGIDARMKKGVLHLSIPRKAVEHQDSRRIEIKS